MLKSMQSRLAPEYARALSDYLTARGETGLRQADELGSLARMLAVPLHEILAIHTAALFSRSTPTSEAESRAASEFLVRSCRAAEAASAADHAQFLRKVAHELRTPLTTLRLSLQVCLRKLEQGEPVVPAALQKAISQVDKLAVLINEQFHGVEAASRPIGQPR